MECIDDNLIRPVSDGRPLSPTLPNFLRTIPHLNCLTGTINGSGFHWNGLDSSLTSAFLHLMHLPTINHIDLSYIESFPLSSLTPSVNLHRLDISYLTRSDPPDEDVSQKPKIHELHTSNFALGARKLLHAKTQDGRPAFNFTDLTRLSMSFEDEQNVRYLLQNAKLLQELHLLVDRYQDSDLRGFFPPAQVLLKSLI